MKYTNVPSTIINPVFGKIYYRDIGDEKEVTFLLMAVSIGENWTTGIAIDASASMKESFGKNLTGSIPEESLLQYAKKGWAQEKKKDGDLFLLLDEKAYEDAIENGYLTWTENLIETEGRKFIKYLANDIDVQTGTNVIYWACGQESTIQDLGRITVEECPTMNLDGPEENSFGEKTLLLPALKHFEKKFRGAEKGMYLFLTDGRLEDLEEVKNYCEELSRKIADGERNSMKCVLIGIGDKVETEQLEDLDFLETEIDIWDTKLAADIRGVEEIVTSLVKDSIVVNTPSRIFDDADNIVMEFTDGLPSKATFNVPSSSSYFELEVSGHARIRQALT